MSGTNDPPPGPPLLWGAWRANANERFYTAWCPACGGDLWLHRNGFDTWVASCENGCSRADMDAAADVLLVKQWRRQNYDDELRSTMRPDDPFASIDAERYIHALTGREARRGFFACPFHGDGDERTPSLHATGTVWHCQACKLGGTIYDFGAALWDIEPREDGFKEIKARLGRELLKVAQ